MCETRKKSKSWKSVKFVKFVKFVTALLTKVRKHEMCIKAINTRNLVSRLNFAKTREMCFSWFYNFSCFTTVKIINCLEFPVYGLGFSPWCPAWFKALMDFHPEAWMHSLTIREKSKFVLLIELFGWVEVDCFEMCEMKP